MPNEVKGIGPLEPELMMIGEAPGKHEDESGQPFVGPTGQIINELFSDLGIKRSDVYITNVVKYRPPMNDMSKLHLIGIDINQCIQELWENEIRPLRPKCILAVGDWALQATTGYTGIMNYRGSILRSRDGDYKVVPTLHPAALFSRFTGEDETKGGLDWTYLKLIKADIARAVDESKTREFNLPERSLQVAHSSLELYKFFREYEKLDKACSDIESINCVPVCTGFAFNKFHGISVPLLQKIGKHQLTDMSKRELAECWRIIDKAYRRLNIIGHNFKYDDFKLGLIGFNIKKVISDTLIKTRVLFPELPDKRLHVCSSLWTREPYYKEDGKEFRLGKDKIERLLHYNGRDCVVDFEVDEEQEKDLVSMAEYHGVPLLDYYYNYQMKKHKFYLKMENNGFRVDFARQAELKKRYTEMQDVVHERLIKLIGHEVNVKSYPQMFELLYKEMKFKLRKKNPTSEDVLVTLLGQTKKKEYQVILTDILEERRIRDQKSRYINFTPDYDDRCKTSYNIIATETCRSSTSILKKPLRPKKMGLPFHTIAAHGRLAKDIKSMFICDPGMVMIKADASQAEARIVAVLCKDWELLEAFDKVDIHRRTAGLIFAYTQKLELGVEFRHPIIDSLPKDGPERFCGKKTRHAGNYKMGKHRFMTEFNTDAQKFDIPMTISEWRAGQMLDLFNAASPKLHEVFHAEVEEALKSTRTLIDPFGGVRVFNGRMEESLFGEGYANIPQRTVSHVVQGAAIRLDEEFDGDANLFWLGEKHDELIFQVPENNWEPYARALKKEMEIPIDFNRYCTLKRDYVLTIPCDVEMSTTHYGAFEKVKLGVVA